MKVQQAAELALADGFAAISKQYSLPTGFPPNVLSAAEQATERAVGDASEHDDVARVIATDIPYVTLDPATSTDLAV